MGGKPISGPTTGPSGAEAFSSAPGIVTRGGLRPSTLASVSIMPPIVVSSPPSTYCSPGDALVEREQDAGHDVVAMHEVEAELGEHHHREALLGEALDQVADRRVVVGPVDASGLHDHARQPVLVDEPAGRVVGEDLGLLVVGGVAVVRVP